MRLILEARPKRCTKVRLNIEEIRYVLSEQWPFPMNSVFGPSKADAPPPGAAVPLHIDKRMVTMIKIVMIFLRIKTPRKI